MGNCCGKKSRDNEGLSPPAPAPNNWRRGEKTKYEETKSSTTAANRFVTSVGDVHEMDIRRRRLQAEAADRRNMEIIRDRMDPEGVRRRLEMKARNARTKSEVHAMDTRRKEHTKNHLECRRIHVEAEAPRFRSVSVEPVALNPPSERRRLQAEAADRRKMEEIRDRMDPEGVRRRLEMKAKDARAKREGEGLLRWQVG